MILPFDEFKHDVSSSQISPDCSDESASKHPASRITPGIVTLRDIASRLNVSHTTVSLALRNHPSISPKRREEVKRLAEQLGYRPDPMLASLVQYRTRCRPAAIHSALAWINHWDQPERLRSYHEFDLYWHGACTAADRFGYRLEEIRWSKNYTSQRIEQILQTRSIRGLLIPPHRLAPEWGDFDWNKFSIVRFGMSVPVPDSHVVTADHQRAVLMVFKKMWEYGYKRIGLVVSADYDGHLGGNYIGGLAAAQELFQFECVLPPLRTNEAMYSEQPSRAKKLLLQWLKKHKPDAILTSLSSVPRMIIELGYNIPRDVAVAGTTVYDIPVDAGINQNPKAIGRAAVEMLVAQINRNDRGVPEAPCRTLVESLWQDGKSMPRLNL
jgi:DNA-binding LacI/PurR family transcriptional regulator